ncbi:hypothetical protein VTL71DRAFT_3153 [Oculimacula yallundae]|uniref:Uncharacterized protein n=1 Tax=Oculimacula yallundae TaxID=86028 RepID=A0ABR4C8J3_9HELO
MVIAHPGALSWNPCPPEPPYLPPSVRYSRAQSRQHLFPVASKSLHQLLQQLQFGAIELLLFTESLENNRIDRH